MSESPKFVKLSTLRKAAWKEAQEHQHAQDRPTRIINKLLGAGATNRQWLQKAKKHLVQAGQHNSVLKVKHLQSGLYEIYMCEHAMSQSPHHDQEVLQIRQLLENAYLQEIISHLNLSLATPQTLFASLGALRRAVQVIAEKNESLANDFFKKLEQAFLLKQAKKRIIELLDGNEESFFTITLPLIEGTLRPLRAAWERHVDFVSQISQALQSRIAELGNWYYQQAQLITGQQQPSLNRLKTLLSEYDIIKGRLRRWADVTDEHGLSTNLAQLVGFSCFVQDYWKKASRAYSQLQTPGLSLDQVFMGQVLDKLEEFPKELLTVNWQECDPKPIELKQGFAKYLLQQAKQDMLDYTHMFSSILSVTKPQLQLPRLAVFAKELHNQAEQDENQRIKQQLLELLTQVQQHYVKLTAGLLSSLLAKACSPNSQVKALDEAIGRLQSIGMLAPITALNQLKQRLASGQYTPEAVAEFAANALQGKPLQGSQQKADKAGHIASTAPNTEAPTQNIQPSAGILLIADLYSSTQLVVFSQQQVSLGRASDNDIVLQASWVSAHHCLLDFAHKRLQDLNSTNGTQINGLEATAQGPALTCLERVHSFSVSGMLEFIIRPIRQGWFFKMDRINNPQNLNLDDSLKALLQAEFVWLPDGGKFGLELGSGNVTTAEPDITSKIIIAIKNNHYVWGKPAQPLTAVQTGQSAGMDGRYRFTLL